jgi:hypothetical protein
VSSECRTCPARTAPTRAQKPKPEMQNFEEKILNFENSQNVKFKFLLAFQPNCAKVSFAILKKDCFDRTAQNL